MRLGMPLVAEPPRAVPAAAEATGGEEPPMQRRRMVSDEVQEQQYPGSGPATLDGAGPLAAAACAESRRQLKRGLQPGAEEQPTVQQAS